MVLGNGGTTAFWDAATFGLIRANSQFLSFGEFGGKFATAAKKTAPHLGEATVIKAEPGDAPSFQLTDGASTCTRLRRTRPPPASLFRSSESPVQTR